MLIGLVVHHVSTPSIEANDAKTVPQPDSAPTELHANPAVPASSSTGNAPAPAAVGTDPASVDPQATPSPQEQVGLGASEAMPAVSQRNPECEEVRSRIGQQVAQDAGGAGSPGIWVELRREEALACHDHIRALWRASAYDIQTSILRPIAGPPYQVTLDIQQRGTFKVIDRQTHPLVAEVRANHQSFLVENPNNTQCNVMAVVLEDNPQMNDAQTAQATQLCSAADAAYQASFVHAPLQNSPDMECVEGHRCTDEEFAAYVADFDRRWALAPTVIKQTCNRDTTVPMVESCLFEATAEWFMTPPGHPEVKSFPWQPARYATTTHAQFIASIGALDNNVAPAQVSPAAPIGTPVGVSSIAPTATDQTPITKDNGPSFDCSKVIVPTAITICGNPELAALDRQMAALYFARSNNGTDVGPRAQQRQWIKQRNDICGVSVDCIRTQFNDRIKQLQQAGIAPTSPAVSATTLEERMATVRGMSESQFGDQFRCPESYATDPERATALAESAVWLQSHGGKMTQAGVEGFRVHLLKEHNCVETLRNIREAEPSAN